MINVSQHSHGKTVAVWLMCSCPHMFVEEPFLYQEKFSCAWALVSCILFCNLSNKFLCFCVCTKTWKMTIADAKEQQELAPNPKVLEKPFHFSCAFTRKFSDTFIPFNLDVGKWNFTWQMSGNSVQIIQEEDWTCILKKRQLTCKNNTTHHNTIFWPETSSNHLITHDPLTWPLWHHYPHRLSNTQFCITII